MRDDVLTPCSTGFGRVARSTPHAARARWRSNLSSRGHDVVGVDVSDGMLTRARSVVPDATFLTGDITRLPLPDNDVDHVVCSLALTHLEDLGPFFSEAARVMRAGGHLIVLDTRGQFIGSRHYPLIRQAPDGRVGYIQGYSHGLGEYVRAALPHGYALRACEETYRNARTVEPEERPAIPSPGPPNIWELHPWARDAANAARAGQAAVVGWDFELRPDV
jgi:SAM-dependent methyltransferase